MDDSFGMDVGQTLDDAGDDEFLIMEKVTGLFFGEVFVVAEVVPEVTSPEVLHGEVEMFPVLEGVNSVDNEGIGHFIQE